MKVLELFEDDKLNPNAKLAKKVWLRYRDEIIELSREGFGDIANNNEIMKNVESIMNSWTPEAFMTIIRSNDPSSNNSFTPWIARTYVNGGIRRWEDIDSRVKPVLEKFMILRKKKQLPIERDINKYSSLESLEDVVEKYSHEAIDTSNDKKIEQNFINTGQVDILYNDNNLKVVEPKSEKASCFYGRSTRWCTASTRGNNYFDEYHRKGSLYIIIVKKENTRYQIHFETKNFMDDRDRPVMIEDTLELTSKFPVLKELFSEKGREAGFIAFYPSLNGENLNNRDIARAVLYDVKNIQFFDNLSNEQMMIAIGTVPMSFSYMNNPPEEVQIWAIEHYSDAHSYIPHPMSEEVQIALIKKNMNTASKIIQSAEMTPKIFAIFYIVSKLFREYLNQIRYSEMTDSNPQEVSQRRDITKFQYNLSSSMFKNLDDSDFIGQQMELQKEEEIQRIAIEAATKELTHIIMNIRGGNYHQVKNNIRKSLQTLIKRVIR